jgi:WD40 repeat protein
VTGSEDGGIRLFDVATGILFAVLEGMRSPVTSVDVSPDEELLVSGSVDCVGVWRKQKDRASPSPSVSASTFTASPAAAAAAAAVSH